MEGVASSTAKSNGFAGHTEYTYVEYNHPFLECTITINNSKERRQG